MKTFLYGTTAMIAAAAVAGTASAQQAPRKPNEKITLQLGGYFEANWVIGDEARGQKTCPIATGCTQPTGAPLPAAIAPLTGGLAGPFVVPPTVPFGGLVNEVGRGRRYQRVNNEREVYFRGQTTLDNGLTVGAFIQLEGSTSQDQIDESYIYFSGSFGRVEWGSMDGVSFQMGYGAPCAIQGHCTQIYNMRQFQVGGNTIGSIATQAAMSGGAPDAEKMNYYTPRIAGFQFGLSFTPKNCEENNIAVPAVGFSSQPTGALTQGLGNVTGASPTVACGGSYGGFTSAQDATVQSEILDLSANFVRKFGPVDIASNVFYAKGHLEAPTGVGTVNSTNRTDENEKGFGLNVSWMNFTLGGAFRRDTMGFRSNNTDRTDYGIGLRYTLGPWRFGVEWAETERGRGIIGAAAPSQATAPGGGITGASGVGAAGTRAGTDKLQNFDAGVDYTMGPGIRFYGGVQYFNLKDAFHNPANENEGVVVILGTRLDF